MLARARMAHKPEHDFYICFIADIYAFKKKKPQSPCVTSIGTPRNVYEQNGTEVGFHLYLTFFFFKLP